MKKYFIFLCLLVPSIACCYEGIKDLPSHRKNTEIISDIVGNELQMKPAGLDAVRYIAENISRIGARALENGFDTDAYTYQVIAGWPNYTWVPLWEGGDIPFTLFIYIWPPRGQDSTPIHSHPIPCALTVLKNSITQENFEIIGNGKVRLSGSKKLVEGDCEVDVLLDSFVHRVSCRENGPEPAFTLHLYAKGTAKEVRNTFYKTFPRHSYNLSEN
jgi:hypothetical protein